MWQRGYTFDYISDRQLAGAKVINDGIVVPGGNFHAVVVPACDHIPLPTLEKLLALAKDPEERRRLMFEMAAAAEQMDAVLVTAAWVHWWNESRLHSACGDIPPAE